MKITICTGFPDGSGIRYLRFQPTWVLSGLLAVHRTPIGALEDDGYPWRVTHVPSGASIGGYADRFAARECAKTLLANQEITEALESADDLAALTAEVCRLGLGGLLKDIVEKHSRRATRKPQQRGRPVAKVVV